jgi:hypothetical protein
VEHNEALLIGHVIEFVARPRPHLRPVHARAVQDDDESGT